MASITSATSGPSNDTATWTGGVIPVVGDKVTIQHPGTNSLAAGTGYLTNTAGYAVGATSITLTTGTGTIVAGESVQFETQTGVDEEGKPILDNSYYKVATGISAPGALVLATGLAVAIPPGSAVAVVNRGHVVTLTGAHVWGDDTSNATTPGSNGIAVLGTLKGSRSANWSLTARGTVYPGSGGTIDFGATGDPIPSGVTGTLTLNDSAALVSGKHGLGSSGTTAVTFRVRGLNRTRNTRLSSSISAGATSISVGSSVGWAVGDRLVLETDTSDVTRAQVVTITGGSSPTWAVTAITNARGANARIANLSSNVVITSIGAATPGFVGISLAPTSAQGRFDVGDCRISDCGTQWAASGALQMSGCLSLGGNLIPASRMQISRVAIETSNSASSIGLRFTGSNGDRWRAYDVAIYLPFGSTSGYANNTGMVDLDFYVYRAATGAQLASGCASALLSGYLAGSAEALAFDLCSDVTLNNMSLVGQSVVFSAGSGVIKMSGGSVQSSGSLCSFRGSGVRHFVDGRNVSVLSGAATTSLFAGASIPSQSSTFQFANFGGSATDHRIRSYYQETATDTGTHKVGTYAVKIKPLVAGLSTRYTFAIPAVTGVGQTIKGFLRFDSNYGTATPPVLSLSGQGVSASFSCPATADTWQPFSLTVTPTSTGDITATVTMQSSVATGFVWLDGVYHFPMIQSVRHYGYQWLPQAAQVVDPRITLTESAALALAVSVNHTTSTITVSAPLTASQVFEACMADLAQTVNLDRAVHLTSADGSTFATTYAVAFSGTGKITTAYTDSGGLRVAIKAPNLIADTRVQLYNVTDGVEMTNVKLTGAGFEYPLVYTADKTVRLRAGYAEGTVAKLPIEAFGVLSSTGLTFLDSQVDDAVYNSLAIDGATITEFAPDFPNVQIDVSDPDGETSAQRLYVWAAWIQASLDGIRLMFRAMSASDTANFLIDQSVVNAKLDNVNGTPVKVVGGYLSRKDGSTVIAAASGSIQMDPGKAYLPKSGALVLAADDRLIVTNNGRFLARG